MDELQQVAACQRRAQCADRESGVSNPLLDCAQSSSSFRMQGTGLMLAKDGMCGVEHRCIRRGRHLRTLPQVAPRGRMERLRIRGAWPGRVEITAGWAKAVVRPWNEDIEALSLRLERGGARFLGSCARVVSDWSQEVALSGHPSVGERGLERSGLYRNRPPAADGAGPESESTARRQRSQRVESTRSRSCTGSIRRPSPPDGGWGGWDWPKVLPPPVGRPCSESRPKAIAWASPSSASPSAPVTSSAWPSPPPPKAAAWVPIWSAGRCGGQGVRGPDRCWSTPRSATSPRLPFTGAWDSMTSRAGCCSSNTPHPSGSGIVPPPLPPRYRLEVRLGRDQDIEEWLATDLNLDRPVLIRILGPDAAEKRRHEFLTTVRAAAAVIHPHLEPIYAAEEVSGGAYAVSEWSGGLTLESRLAGGNTLDPLEFAANAAGLAGALAALHETGLVHGAIDSGSILYTVARPARLGGFGRPRRYLTTPVGDVTDLATVLEQLPHGITRQGALLLRKWSMDSPGRSTRPSPTPGWEDSTPRVSPWLWRRSRGPTPPEPEDPRSRKRAPLLAAALIVIAIGLIALGRVLAGDVTVPVIPGPSASAPTSSTTASTTTTTQPGSPVPVLIAAASTYDPYGEGGENDGSVGLVIDGDPSTTWRTERYRDPDRTPQARGRADHCGRRDPAGDRVARASAPVWYFRIFWSESRPPEPSQWEQVASGGFAGAPAGDSSFPRVTEATG